MDGPSPRHRSLLKQDDPNRTIVPDGGKTVTHARVRPGTVPIGGKGALGPYGPGAPRQEQVKLNPGGWAKAAAFVKAGRERLHRMVQPKPAVEIQQLNMAQFAAPQQDGIGQRRASQALPRTSAPELEALFPGIELSVIRPTQGGCNESYFVREPSGVEGVFKPRSGEVQSIRVTVPNNSEAFREIAASAVDGLLGFNLVPATRGVSDSTMGPGSLMRMVDGRQSMYVPYYSPLDQERMGVLDYILANTDRHEDNWLTDQDGRPAAIDNGLAFPTGDAFPIRSQWVRDLVGKPLSQEVLDQVRAVSLEKFRATLEAVRIEPEAIDGAVARLQEVQQGAIMLESWHGGLFAGWGFPGPKIEDFDFGTQQWVRRGSIRDNPDAQPFPVAQYGLDQPSGIIEIQKYGLKDDKTSEPFL